MKQIKWVWSPVEEGQGVEISLGDSHVCYKEAFESQDS